MRSEIKVCIPCEKNNNEAQSWLSRIIDRIVLLKPDLPPFVDTTVGSDTPPMANASTEIVLYKWIPKGVVPTTVRGKLQQDLQVESNCAAKSLESLLGKGPLELSREGIEEVTKKKDHGIPLPPTTLHLQFASRDTEF